MKLRNPLLVIAPKVELATYRDKGVHQVVVLDPWGVTAEADIGDDAFNPLSLLNPDSQVSEDGDE